MSDAPNTKPAKPPPPPPGWKPKLLLLDVDGVLTTGQFLYSVEGKAYKVFGPDDHDALLLLKPFLQVRCVSGDRKGFEITRKRVADDMKLPVDLVSTLKRIHWIRELCDPREVIYMGDGIFDHYVFRQVGYSICPANGAAIAKLYAHHVTTCGGGDRAVAEACLHILERFFTPFDPEKLPDEISSTGEWGL